MHPGVGGGDSHEGFLDTHPPHVVGTLFLMIECSFKFDGQIEIVHVFNLTRLVF